MPMPLKKWREQARRRLREVLGGKCVDCGKPHTEEEPLQFSHVIPLDEEQASYRTRMGATHRLVMYRREAKEGLLTLRCRSCNMAQRREPKQGFFTFSHPTVDIERIPF